jgi:hypothetical protein
MGAVNFCSECGKDLRIAHPERFCGQCGREFQGPVQLRAISEEGNIAVVAPPTATAHDARESYEALRTIALDLAMRFSFSSTPSDVANYHQCPPLHVDEDHEFETFDDGSVSTDYRVALFPLGEKSLPGVDLLYRFQQKEYVFYASGDVTLDGLGSIMFANVRSLGLSRPSLHQALGAPSDSRLLDSFDQVDEWLLNTPSATKSKEKLVAYYGATSPDIVESVWLEFPEL